MTPWSIRQAVRILSKGGIIAYPTEAVYGVGCLAHFNDSIQRLLDIKQRPVEKGLILLASDLSQLDNYIKPLDKLTLNKIQATWPGPVTWLLPARDTTSPFIRGQHHSVAVRLSAHPIVQTLCRLCDAPLISTSANLSGRAMTYTPFQVRLQFQSKLDMILSGELGDSQKPTIIRDALTDRVIRS